MRLGPNGLDGRPAATNPGTSRLPLFNQQDGVVCPAKPADRHLGEMPRSPASVTIQPELPIEIRL